MKKAKKTVIKEFIDKHPHAYDELMEILYKIAKDGDIDSAKYVLDRLKGRPHISIDSRLSGDIKLDYTLIIDRVSELEQGTIEGEYIEEGQ